MSQAIPLFTVVPGFTDALDVIDPKPPSVVSSSPPPITNQVVGYSTPGPPGLQPSPESRSGMLWTKRKNLPPQPNNLSTLCNVPFSQVLSANGAQYHTHAVGWASNVPNEVHPAIFEHPPAWGSGNGLRLLCGLNGAPGTLAGGASGQAHSVNNPDQQVIQIAGWTADATGLRRPVRWTIPIDANNASVNAQQSIPIELIPVEGEALDIHDNGQVVGWFRSAAGMPHAFLWTAPGPQFRDLGTLGGARSIAYASSADGSVVGAADTSAGEMHAFLWKPGETTGVASNPEMTDLGAWGDTSAALDTNDYGVVVGWSTSPTGEEMAAFWVNKVLKDVQSLATIKIGLFNLDLTGGWTFTRANAINNDGHIVGLGRTPLGGFGAWRTPYIPTLNRDLLQLRHLYSSVVHYVGGVPYDGPGIGIPFDALPFRVPPRPPYRAEVEELLVRIRELLARMR